MFFKRPELLTIFVIVFVDVLGFTVILPLLPFYTEKLGASPFIVGALVSVFGVCQLLSGPVLGQMSDRVGRRPVLLISQVGTLIGLIILAMAQQLWMVFLARIIDGITAGNITVAQAYISDVTKPQERTKAMGLIGAAFGLGFIVGPAISGILARYGTSAPIWASCVLSFLSILGSYFFLKDVEKAKESSSEKRSRRDSYRELFAKPETRAYYVSYFAFGFSFATLTSGLAMFCERRLSWGGEPFSAEQVGYLLACSGTINLSMQIFFLGRLVQRFGETRLVRFAFASSTLGLIMIGVSENFWIIVVGLLFNALGTALQRPSLTGLISRSVSPKHQGLALGFSQTLVSVAQIICPLISGYLIMKSMYFTFAATAAAASLMGLIAAIFTHPRVELSNAASSSLPEFH